MKKTISTLLLMSVMSVMAGCGTKISLPEGVPGWDPEAPVEAPAENRNPTNIKGVSALDGQSLKKVTIGVIEAAAQLKDLPSQEELAKSLDSKSKLFCDKLCEIREK